MSSVLVMMSREDGYGYGLVMGDPTEIDAVWWWWSTGGGGGVWRETAGTSESAGACTSESESEW